MTLHDRKNNGLPCGISQLFHEWASHISYGPVMLHEIAHLEKPNSQAIAAVFRILLQEFIFEEYFDETIDGAFGESELLGYLIHIHGGPVDGKKGENLDRFF